MNVRLTPRALSEAERSKTWWQKNRPRSPSVFNEKMATALEQIQTVPTVGAVYPSSFGRTVRRLLMPKTKNHVYYLVRENEVVVLSVLGRASRERPEAVADAPPPTPTIIPQLSRRLPDRALRHFP
jgi:plasmid stabilization system protein ParE